MKYSKPEDVVIALKEGKVKVSSIKQYSARLKSKGDHEKAEILDKGLLEWENKGLDVMCTYYNKPVDDLSLAEILAMYDKDSRLLTTSHCLRFTILMMEDTPVSIRDYKGMLIHPRDIYLEE